MPIRVHLVLVIGQTHATRNVVIDREFFIRSQFTVQINRVFFQRNKRLVATKLGYLSRRMPCGA